MRLSYSKMRRIYQRHERTQAIRAGVKQLLRRKAASKGKKNAA